jgi:uncharacterized integral membrane protein (TIGR00698 family)
VTFSLKEKLSKSAAKLSPGLLMCAIIAIAAQFIAEHYGAPAMLMALLLGLAMHPFGDSSGRAADGVKFSASTLLRIAVALLGVRISFDVFVGLGPKLVLLVVCALILTVGFGFIAAKELGRGWRLAILTSGAVSICGASAALAISALLPKNEFTERNLSFTVFGVTILSTIAMVLYPIIINLSGLNDEQAGIFLGGTIHDVAQVVGAGFSISDVAGETATSVKLIRVSLLAPFVIILGVIMGRLDLETQKDGKRPPLIPPFVLAFAVLVMLSSFGIFPEWLKDFLAGVSQWFMLMAIAGVGVKTELKRLVEIPKQSIALLCFETIFIAVLIFYGLYWIGV